MYTKADIENLAEDFENCRKEATKNYYYFDPDMKSFDRLIHVLRKAKELTAGLPDRSEPI